MWRLWGALITAIAVLFISGTADAQEAAGTSQKIAVLRFDALGIDEARVDKLEALFRMELGRLAGSPIPSRREVELALSKSSALRRCGGETDCLAKIGRKMKVDLVVSGNVAGLGESYVVNIKVVDVATTSELRRIASEPLRGNPDELIAAVRVAAYKLLAPDQLTGGVMVLADLDGATITLDDKPVGSTPMAKPLLGLDLGKHRLRVTAEGFSEFSEEVLIRFQKTTRVVVRLATDSSSGGGTDLTGGNGGPRDHGSPVWYQSTWFKIAVGVSIIAVGAGVGYAIGKDSVRNCTTMPTPENPC